MNKIELTMFPENMKCIICGQDLPAKVIPCICCNCFNLLPWNVINSCLKCGDNYIGKDIVCKACKQNPKDYAMSKAPFIYKPPISNLIQSFKYDNSKYLSVHFAAVMAMSYKTFHMKADIICYVPMFIKKKKQRGYNQAELLAKDLGKILNLPVDFNCLKKIVDTKSQIKKSYFKRKENLSSVYKIDDVTKIQDKKILLIDDVLTTGATIDACCKALKPYVKEIFVLTIARTLKK